MELHDNWSDFCDEIHFPKLTFKHRCIPLSVCSWQLLVFAPEQGHTQKSPFGLLLPVRALGCTFDLILLYFWIFFDTFNMRSPSAAKLSTAPWTRARLHRLAFPPTTNLCWVSTIHGMTSHCERRVHCTCLHAYFWLWHQAVLVLITQTLFVASA